MSRKELQQILLDTFAKHGRVREPLNPSLSSCSMSIFIYLMLLKNHILHLIFILFSMFTLQVKSIELSPHTDYQLKAKVQMGSLQQAIGAVSILHRYKIGNKRIHVSLITGVNNKSLTCLRYWHVASINHYGTGLRLHCFHLRQGY